MTEMDKYYQILGLNPGASEEEVRKTYKILIKVWDPTRFLKDPNMQKIANEKMKGIDEAYKKLLIFIDCNYEQKKKIPETRSEVKDEVQNIIVELSTAFKGDSRPYHLQKEGRADDQSPPDPGKDAAGSAQSQDKQGPSGIGGWLMLLVIGMMVLGPLFGAGRINADIMTVERQYPHLVSLDQWITFKSATWWTFLGVAALSFYGGWGLARGKDWSVVNRAKWILWISGPVGSLVMGVFIPIIIVGESNAGDGQFVGAFIAQVIAAGIWTAYLSKSKRVRNTYSG